MNDVKTHEIYSVDLAGVIVGETAISDVQGERGLLSYRGQPIEDIARKPFLQVAWLLVFGDWPGAFEEHRLGEFAALHRRLSAVELGMLRALPRDLHPMLMLQSMIPALAVPEHSEAFEFAPDATQGLAIAAKLPSLIAAWYRLRLGQDIIPSSSSLSPSDDFLRMLHGRVPTPEHIAVLDTTQILQMEHSYNAGTFAGRVCASTASPLQSVISASVGTLFGALHGGADQAALEMARHIGDPANAGAYVKECLRNKTKIMGMGHREYRLVDPRARILKPMAAALCNAGEGRRLFEILCAVEEACQREFAIQGKQIWANVEFYKGAVFHSLGIPDDFFTAMFAMARVYGYVAHYLEFKPVARLIRPRARYVAAAVPPASSR